MLGQFGAFPYPPFFGRFHAAYVRGRGFIPQEGAFLKQACATAGSALRVPEPQEFSSTANERQSMRMKIWRCGSPEVFHQTVILSIPWHSDLAASEICVHLRPVAVLP